MDIDRFEELLDLELAEIPDKYFVELSGGAYVREQVKFHEASVDQDLVVMGEYHYDILGRYIVIYYGSFMAVYGDASEEFIQGRLRQVVRHELTHHLESLAGERDLEIQDAIEILQYLERKKKEKKVSDIIEE